MAYTNWKDSPLSAKLSESKISNIDKIWKHANEIYPPSLWDGWVDHGAIHALRVLRNLDRLIPKNVYDDIKEEEAFILIVSVLLHDIGMVLDVSRKDDVNYLVELRKKHGKKGASIIRNTGEIKGQIDGDLLPLICDIVENHHGDFLAKRKKARNVPNSRTDALWVRLADGLDFGPGRAPTWLFKYINPDEEQLEHWKMHNKLHEPIIDTNLFRIEIHGEVENDAFIQNLQDNFENDAHQDLQEIFLGRGTNDNNPKTFIIWDKTVKTKIVGDDSKETDSRPSIFREDKFLDSARYLYNIAKYDTAMELFDKGVEGFPKNWVDAVPSSFFYHYLQCFNKLGDYEKALKISQNHDHEKFSPEIEASIAISQSISNWKLSRYTAALDNLRKAEVMYHGLSFNNPKHFRNEADSWVLYSIVHLEKGRKKHNDVNIDMPAVKDIEKIIDECNDKAMELYSMYNNHNTEIGKKEPESHYMGRYYGLKAFHTLFAIDLSLSGENKISTDAWDEAQDWAAQAYGGDSMEKRVPFGIMSGKYCEAAVLFHKYCNYADTEAKQKALEKSADSITYTLESYKKIYDNKTIPHTLPKIYSLCKKIIQALEKEENSGKAERINTILSSLGNPEEPCSGELEIYTPLN
ncbi:MAG: HD domain-containing protein [bacterium]|nr:HD domain-containing protein [bacterium]